ncbi:MAG: hypothetical protein A2Y40_07485 [Candidatus Margulisbacteria bacterium GWF2_35_9]|nr:MAG: hypothetical protein A2Y40_07485 [Candidatus Margulisbacteria bacterium GWF2_35_9]
MVFILTTPANSTQPKKTEYYPPQEKKVVSNPDVSITTRPISPITITQVQKPTVSMNISKYKTTHDTFKDTARKIDNCQGLLEQGKEIYVGKAKLIRDLAKFNKDHELFIPSGYFYMNINIAVRDKILDQYKKDFNNDDSWTIRELTLNKAKLDEVDNDPFYKKTLDMIDHYDTPLKWQSVGKQNDPRFKFIRDMYIKLCSDYAVYMIYARNQYKGKDKLAEMEKDFYNFVVDILYNNYMTPTDAEAFYGSITYNYTGDVLLNFRLIQYILDKEVDKIIDKIDKSPKTAENAKKYILEIQKMLDDLSSHFSTGTIPLTDLYYNKIGEFVSDAIHKYYPNMDIKIY